MAAKLCTVIALLALVAGAQAATIYQTAKAAGLTTLVAAVDAAGLKSVLDDPNAKLTVFAPTNEAFAALLAALKLTPAQLLANKPLLTDVLKYHVLSTPVYKSKIPSSFTSVKTLLGKNLRVKNGHWGVVIRFGKKFASKSKVVKANVKADKSVVHVINTVLVPPM